MLAENKGFVYNANSIVRMVGASDENLQTLVDFGYLRKVNGGYEITHWYENNGIGETAKKRNNYKYRKWRSDIIGRDKICQLCASAENLEVHHIKSFAEYPELRFDFNNGIVLCRKCHKNLHRRKKNGKKKDV